MDFVNACTEEKLNRTISIQEHQGQNRLKEYSGM